MKNARRWIPGAWLALYCSVCLCSLVWPLYPRMVDSARPFVLGLPLAIAWHVGWLTMTFLVVLVYHLRHGERDGS